MRDKTAPSEATPLLPPSDRSDGLGHTWPAQLAPTWLARALFAWLDPLMALGARRPLQQADLLQLDPPNRAQFVCDALQRHWLAERALPTPRLTRALARTFGGPVARAAVLKLAFDALQFVLPLMIQRIVAFLLDPTAPRSQGLALAGVVAAVGLTQSFVLRNYAFQCFQTGLRVRSALNAVVFRKALALSSAARRRRTAGEITNLLSADAARVQNVATHINSLWFSLLQIVAACALLWQQLGVAMLAGVCVIVAMGPTTGALSRRMGRFQRTLMNAKDARLKACYEVLSGIKIIKLRAWENVFAKRVLAERDAELNRLDAYVRVRGQTSAVFAAVPALVAATSFLAFVLLGNVLDVGTALTSLALFNILRFPLLGFPQLLNSVVEAGVSVERLRAFLCEDERVEVGAGDLTDVGVKLQDADFGWDDEPKAALRGVSLAATSGQLWAIVGHVGAGKSTLLSGLLGDASCSRGQVAVRGSVAYVAQQPFILNASVRDNITFGRAFEAARYAEAVRVSSLAVDLAALPAGDATEIGEKGINLSGGQRTRVALARAVYQDADVYLLDDVLSAVDAHVARAIFTECIQTALKSKLVVLTTHALTVLPQCDRVVVLAGGEVVENGTYEQLLGEGTQSRGVLRELVEKDEEHDATDADTVAPTVSPDTDEIDAAQPEKVSSSSTKTPPPEVRSLSPASGRLLVDEDRSTGDVAWPVYAWWIDAMGGRGVALFAVGVFCAAQAIDVLATLWLSYWSQHAAPQTSSQLAYLAVFVGLNALFACGLYVRSITVFLRGLRASRVVYEAVFGRVVRAPMAFFDTTPLGRIVNRLSKDVYAVDESLPGTAIQLASTVVSVTATLVTISYVTPLFMVVLVPVGAGFYVSQRYFVKTSRELQRLDAIARSPVVALLAETLDGLSTIHAFRAAQQFTQRYDQLLDASQRAYLLTFAVNGWLGLRLDFAGTLVSTSAALAAVLVAQNTAGTPQGAAFAGLAGVALSYAFSVTHALNYSVRTLSQLQMQMVSVERLQTYAQMEAEPFDQDASHVAWPPHDGQVEFRGVTLRYRAGTPRVLHDLSFTVRARDKVGVVGRTGAGKSSLVVALLRLVELEAGAIYIDGVDTKTLELHALRSSISIIPQDPVLFSGTVRSNVDPLEICTDDEIWVALRRVHLGESVVASLDARVDEKGANWSVGQRQLLCIARALLVKARILVLDEATASIDTETDRAIQRALRDEFRDCTCLTIAHRLRTIMDADRVLVMDGGRVAEFDTPAMLLANEDSKFKALVDSTRNE